MPLNFEFAYDIGGTDVPIVHLLPIADSQTLVRGDAVVLSSGKVAKAADGTGRVLGFMAEDVTTGGSAGGPLRKVYINRAGFVWKCKASADATTHVLAARTYDLNAAQAINVADTTGGCFEIVKLGASVTDVYVVATANELA